MTDDFLKMKVRRVIRRYQWLGIWRKLAVWWGIAALAAVIILLVQGETGWSSPDVLPLFLAAAVSVALGVVIHQLQRPPDMRWVAQQIEARHPELNGVLLTAVQQSLTPGAENSYLQYRVLQEATARSQETDWQRVVPASRMSVAHALHFGALACMVFAVAGLRVTPILGEAPGWVGADGIAVTPGDATIERGETLVVLARFGGSLPPSVNLVVRESGTAPKNIPLVKSLADPVFGGSVSDVASDFTYQLEYRGQRTREFKVTVYEHPRLVRSDVELKFPDYTKLPPKRIEDTRRVSAVEGTKLDLALQLNKPVKSAKLVARDAKKTEIPLAVTPGRAVAALTDFVPLTSQSYDLQLIDAEGRANKVAAPFVINVQPNRAPEIRLASPRGDVRPSALEEVMFEGTVWDDYGAPVYGLAYSIGGTEPKFIELGRDIGPKEKRTFKHVLNLEELGAKPDDLIAWYVWADDVGPDARLRRTSGDMYFAEVRPFDEIFRESQNMEGGGEGQQGGQGNEMRRLTELQKQIINATWKLQREGMGPKYAEDVKVVTESQQHALAQAENSQAEARSPSQQALWRAATQEMEKAIEKLTEAAKEPAPLAQALPAEQAAYQALLKLQARETAVTRSQRGQQGGGGGGQQMTQRQLDQLDLQQAENRYETQRQARAPQNEERREQLAVMNRLQELARRQQDLNERLRELQTALQEARTEQEREDIRRRLKRLQEEQQQMLADVDEVRQRMDRPENQSRMSDERQQLDQTREDIQRAAEAAADGSVAQALASGTRAQRQLQQLRDDMRKENSSQFAEDMREMRNQARELSRQQEELTQKIDALANGTTQRKSLSGSGDRTEMLDQLTEQRERMNQLVDRATQVSEQAENSEPLLSRQLYDSLRKLNQDDANSVKQARDELLASGQLTFDLRDRLQKAADREGSGKSLEVTREMLRDGAISQASRAGQRARAEIDELKRGVERAAESVLGDDVEQLRLARSELDALTDLLQREIAQAEGQGQDGSGRPGQERGGQPGQRERDGRQAGMQPGDDEQQPGAGEREGQQPGEAESDGGQQPGRGSQRMAGNDPQNQQGGQSGQQPGGEQSGGDQSGQQQGQGGGGGSGGDGRMAGNDENATPEQRRQALEERLGELQRQSRGGRGQLADGQGSQNREGGGSRGALTVEDLLREGGGGGAYDYTGGWGGWNGGTWRGGPLLGEDFSRWAERLRDVEELLDAPDLRNAVAEARERARLLRREIRQDLKKPDWAVVQLEILKPLVEVRSRVADELARRESKDSLVPIDRDPVPSRFAESVRRYYEELGRDR